MSVRDLRVLFISYLVCVVVFPVLPHLHVHCIVDGT